MIRTNQTSATCSPRPDIGSSRSDTPNASSMAGTAMAPTISIGVITRAGTPTPVRFTTTATNTAVVIGLRNGRVR